jgi:hypothetical protein
MNTSEKVGDTDKSKKKIEERERKMFLDAQRCEYGWYLENATEN